MRCGESCFNLREEEGSRDAKSGIDEKGMRKKIPLLLFCFVHDERVVFEYHIHSNCIWTYRWNTLSLRLGRPSGAIAIRNDDTIDSSMLRPTVR